MTSFMLFLLAVIWLLYQLFSQKPCPPGSRFDFEKSEEDFASGIGVQEWERRKRKGYYYSTPEEMARRQEEKEVIPGVVDIKRYEYDKKLWGIEETERRRAEGRYLYEIKIKGL